MSASIFPPERLNILDPGNVPECWVDGCAYYTEANGIVRTGFYVLEPVLSVVGDADLNPQTIAKLCFRFRCATATQRAMCEQMSRAQKLVSDAAPLAAMGIVRS